MIGNTISGNNTIEFGVIRDHFTLIFEINGEVNETVALKIH